MASLVITISPPDGISYEVLTAEDLQEFRVELRAAATRVDEAREALDRAWSSKASSVDGDLTEAEALDALYKKGFVSTGADGSHCKLVLP